MDKDRRKALLTAYRERKVTAGVYVVRCKPTGATWVGSASDLDKVANRLAFTLGQGVNANRSLQLAWKQYGAEAFAIEELEHIDEDLPGYLRPSKLNDRRESWVTTLGATRI